jgi:NADPH:quinone reductase-like Zn-dependent oxidoreductase
MTHAIRFTRVRGPEVLELAEAPLPEPGASEALGRQRGIGH